MAETFISEVQAKKVSLKLNRDKIKQQKFLEFLSSTHVAYNKAMAPKAKAKPAPGAA